MVKITLGTHANSFPLWPSNLGIEGKDADVHFHIMAVAGMGKSKLLESIALQRIREGQAVGVLDPHSDLVNSTLANLISLGYFKQPDAFDKLLYIEFENNLERYLPMNFLSQPHAEPDVIADDTLEAFKRCWPELATGAPQFSTLVINGVRALIANDLPIPALYPFLLDENYRHRLLANVDNYGVKAYFDNFERLRPSEQADQSASTLRRLNLLTSSPVLEYCLGQKDNFLNFRQIIDNGVSCLFDLGNIHNAQARRLLGAMLMVGFERAALSRLGTNAPRTVFHMLIDEFSQFSAQSSDALAVMLSETRKAGLFACLAHQTWGQLGDRLHGALQNVGVKVALRIGREDAEVMAKWYGATDPMAVKFEPARDGMNPVTFSLQEQWEGYINSLMSLPQRQALVKVGDKPAVQIKTLDVPEPKVSAEEIQEIKEEYRRRLMRSKEHIVLPYQMEEEETIGRSAPRR